MMLYLVSVGRDTLDYVLKGVFDKKDNAEKLKKALEQTSDEYGVCEVPDDIEEIERDETSDYCSRQYWFQAVYADDLTPVWGKPISGWEAASAIQEFTIGTQSTGSRIYKTVKSYVSVEHLQKLIKERAWEKLNSDTTR